MDLVAEQNRAALLDAPPLSGFADDLAHARHALGHGAEGHELLGRVVREQTRERGLAAAGRAPQDHAADRAALDGFAQRFAGAEQLLVAEKIRERLGTQPVRERRVRFGGGRGLGGEQLRLFDQGGTAPPATILLIAARV